MRIADVPTGEWFKDGADDYYMKMDQFTREDHAYQAVNLVTGDPAFVARTSDADSPALSDADVTLVEKPTDYFLPSCC